MKRILPLLLSVLLLAVCTAHAESAQQGTAVLIFDSFAGGGPAYTVSIEDESILSWSERHDFGSPENELMDGAAYDVIFTFTALRPGITAVTVRWRSPIMEPGEAYYTAAVDNDLILTLKEEPTMTIDISGKVFTALLEDNETARAFAALFPLELRMTELNGNEKYHYLMGPLPADPERVGHIEAGDIMLFGENCVVLFYASFDTPYSYTRIGRITDPASLADQLDGGEAVVSFGP